MFMSKQATVRRTPFHRIAKMRGAFQRDAHRGAANGLFPGARRILKRQNKKLNRQLSRFLTTESAGEECPDQFGMFPEDYQCACDYDDSIYPDVDSYAEPEYELDLLDAFLNQLNAGPFYGSDYADDYDYD